METAHLTLTVCEREGTFHADRFKPLAQHDVSGFDQHHLQPVLSAHSKTEAAVSAAGRGHPRSGWHCADVNLPQAAKRGHLRYAVNSAFHLRPVLRLRTNIDCGAHHRRVSRVSRRSGHVHGHRGRGFFRSARCALAADSKESGEAQ